jgi:hypothetical protein
MARILWLLYEKTGREHLAECDHLSDTVGWPDRPDVTAVKGTPKNPCRDCLVREAKELE